MFVAGSALALGVGASGCDLEPLAAPAADAGADSSADAGVDTGPDASPVECTSDGACDHHGPCEIGRCIAGSCTSAAAAAGVSCADLDHCNGEETCDGHGQCSPGVPVPIDDGNPCTKDACDPTTGQVAHAITPGCIDWVPTPAAGAPLAREKHTGVWSGQQLIVWGGQVTGTPPVTATGGVYDPTALTWTPTTTLGAPPPRHSHVAVWAGQQMIVWGGYGASGYEATGSIYDPSIDAWVPMTTTGAPTGRRSCTAVWTGTELIVWGGSNGNYSLGDGGRYDPLLDAWRPVALNGAPSPRESHSALWNGSRMVVWGGTNTADWMANGGIYDPATDTWVATSALQAPGPRQSQTAVTDGSKMLLWGGWNGGPYLDTGASWDPLGGLGGTWTPMSTLAAPAARQGHGAAWTGTQMLVWGGCGSDACATLYDDGGLWTPGAAGGAWLAIPSQAALAGRFGHTLVWTGTQAIVWGGRTAAGRSASGAQGSPG